MGLTGLARATRALGLAAGPVPAPAPAQAPAPAPAQKPAGTPAPAQKPAITPLDLSRRRRDGFRKAVLDSSQALWRDFPWRRTRDPWLILVSEVMLQQTQAARVVGPYLAFVERFPTPRSCADAGSASVVRAWDGLGYNRRAVNLHRAATAIVDRHGGRVPVDLATLRALPGVGEYTARAVLAFAYELPVGVVDTNVVRVLARAVAARPLRPAESQCLADRLVPARGSWRFNQALFDIGAQVCTAARPKCTVCPLRRRCGWATAGTSNVPDPAARLRSQTAFHGSDRQGRGRLVAALRRAPVPASGLADAAGWPDNDSRARLVAEALVSDGIAIWSGELLHLA